MYGRFHAYQISDLVGLALSCGSSPAVPDPLPSSGCGAQMAYGTPSSVIVADRPRADH